LLSVRLLKEFLKASVQAQKHTPESRAAAEQGRVDRRLAAVPLGG